MASIPWTQKYLPKKIKDVVGQDKAVSELMNYVKSYGNKGNKCVIVYGGVGSGKTSAVYAIASELQLELIEMNASDFRNKDAIKKMLGTAVLQRSLFFSGKLILIDEIDGLSGNEDRGGVQAIKDVVEESVYPVVCTVNDPYDDKLSSLRKSSILIEFGTLDYRTITNRMKAILENEKCKYDEEALKTLARKQGGDMRGAINDLQTLTASGTKDLDMQSVKEFEYNDRHKTDNMMNAILKVLKTTDLSIAKDAFENVDEDQESIGLWLEENIPKEYEGLDLANAMMMLSRADVYKGRIRRWQHWRFLVYIYALYGAGVALSKKEKYKKFVQYGPTKKLLKIWINNAKYAKRKAIAQKIAPKLHNGRKGTIRDTIPYIRIMCKRSPEFAETFCKEYDLDEDEMEWLVK